jgi:hypothetical protein
VAAPEAVVTPASVATIESPLQAVALLEAVAVGAIRRPDVLFVRGPRPAIDRVLALGDPALRDATVTCPSRSIASALARAREVVVGDVFSGLTQSALGARRGGRVVLLEDGAAAIRAWRILGQRAGPLTRAHGGGVLARAVGHVAARRLRSLARHSQVSVVAGLPMGASTAAALTAAGFDVVRHDFPWTRSVRLEADPVTAAVTGTPSVVLGSALAADGHVEHAFYEQWLAGCLERGPVVFLPHRRDAPRTSQLARERGAVVGAPALPAELTLRDVVGELVVESLPMTAVLSVPIVRAARPTVVHTTRVPPDAWTPSTPAAMVELAEDIAALASA